MMNLSSNKIKIPNELVFSSIFTYWLNFELGFYFRLNFEFLISLRTIIDFLSEVIIIDKHTLTVTKFFKTKEA